MDTLHDILRRLQAMNPSLRQRIRESEAVSHWEAVVGPQIAKHAVAKKIENGVLFVEVDHSIWKSEVHHRKTQILEKLNQRLGNTAESRALVKEIFLVDPIRFHRG